MTPATFPFGDFCIFGTNSGPGGACRFSGDNIYQDTRCIASIAIAAALSYFAVAKIKEFRNFIKGVGGVKEAFDLIKNARTTAEASAAWANTAKITLAVAADYLNTDLVKKECDKG